MRIRRRRRTRRRQQSRESFLLAFDARQAVAGTEPAQRDRQAQGEAQTIRAGECPPQKD